MKTKTKSFQIPSAKPVDVEYRLRRAMEATGDVLMFVKAIDASALPEEKRAAVMAAINTLAATLFDAQDAAPKKKARKAKPVKEVE